MAENIDDRTRAEFQQFELREVTMTENELGRGSYAVVLELRYRGLKCAGKRLHRVLYETGIGHAARRYLEECRLLSQTRHPNIVQFIGVYFEEGSQFPILVMEFLPTNLTSCLERYGILPDEISYSILNDVSLGLSYLHGQTPVIVHRDLSGNNVLLSTNMSAKISDLGVAKILNLTPLQRMTETPGTQAYMPPEVMVADPQYGVCVDEFSFGTLMVHVFTAEWPAPKVGQTRVDPANPHRVIGVTEAERREYFLRKIGQVHPLMDLIMRCLSNNPAHRPHADEIVGRMSDIALRFPPSFENRVEMLRRISEDGAEKRQLELEIDRRAAQIEEKERENATLRQEKERELASFRQDKERQQQEHEAEMERLTLATSTEMEQLQIQVADKEAVIKLKETETANTRSALSSAEEDLASSMTELKTAKEDVDKLHIQLAQKEITISSQERELSNKTTALSSATDDLALKTAQVEQLQQQMTQQKEMLSLQERELVDKTVNCEKKTNEISSLTSDLSSTRAALDKKGATIEGLNSQLTRLRTYLTSKPQPLQTPLSFSQCADTPVAMSIGQSVVIGDKVYYGGGASEIAEDERRIHCYSSYDKEWSTLPPHPHRQFGLGQIKGKLVTVGGASVSDNKIRGEMYRYDTKWTKMSTPMPAARRFPMVLSQPSWLIVAGGLGGVTRFEDIVEIYNINTSQWSQANRLPIACGLLSGGVHNNTVYLIGGRDKTGRLNKSFVASIDSLLSSAGEQPLTQATENHSSSTNLDNQSTWTEVTPTPAYWPSTLFTSNMILAIGGRKSSDFSDYQPVKGVYAYSTSINSWIHIADLPAPLAGAIVAALSPTEFIIIGGRNKEDQRTKTVYKGTFNVSITQ